ncbi:MAG: hypothetical protein QOG69_1571, partial [Actinomycetota bacterium]|nr:hypothetical protein [Actinomycetota bacterium]
LALLLGSAGVTAQAAATPQAPPFGQPTISGIQGVGFEQDLRLDPTNPNRLYTSVPGSLSSDTSWIWHSEDAGKTFKWVSAALPLDGKPTSCAGGGDTELAVDSAGHLYFNDLTLVNFSTTRSDNGGRNFTNGAAGDCSHTGVPDAAVDRQWYATDGDPTNGGNIYLTNDEIGPGAPTCGSSTGNNVLAMYRSPLPAASTTAGVQFGPGFKITNILACDEGIMGNDEVSPVTHHIFVIHDNAAFDDIDVARCVTVAFGAPVAGVSDPSGLNCVDHRVTTFPGFKTGGNFPTMAIDRSGNLYAVWEQAPVDSNGNIVGDTVLKYSVSTDEATTWSTPITVPTPGLHNNVLAWPAAGDDGRVDIAFYGTSAVAPAPVFNQSCNNNVGATESGPDITNGLWSLYLVQTLNGHAGSPSFTAPILAGEHYNHKGTIQTVMGGQCGDRTLGDFIQLRVGNKGEAEISYADSNNIDEAFAPHGMYVRQNAGTGLYASTSPVSGDPILLNTTTDPSGDGTYDAAGVSSANLPNLDILGSSMSRPASSDCHPAGTPCYRVRMTVNNLSLNPPATEVAGTLDGDTDIVWHTQWLVPADPACTSGPGCAEGGKNFFVYAESTGGQNAQCFYGENAAAPVGGGVALTYPGATPITDPAACAVAAGPGGTITIDVPIAGVNIASLNSTLYSVTASTMTLQTPANTAPSTGGLGGQLFNLIDVARAYDANFTSTTTVTSLTLAPKTGTDVVGTQHCVTATVSSASGSPAAGVTVRFSVSGANSSSGSGTTNASGQAQFCYTGTNAGSDAISAFADLNKNAVQDPGEPGDTASETWTARSTAGCDAKVTGGGQITTSQHDQATFGGEATGLTSGSASGNEQYQDHGPASPMDVKSTVVTSITCNAQRTQASIFGQATIGGTGFYSYEIDVVDNGEPGSNDHYRMRLSNGYDSGDHTLAGGNIKIR